MKLWALSDVHVGYPINRKAIETLEAHPEDWMILAGDLGETEAHLRLCLETCLQRFAKVIWVPGNHELYTMAGDPLQLRGQARYEHLVALCQGYGVLTPEDPFEIWHGEGPPRVLAPLFLLYDYSFAPSGMSPLEAKRWAAEEGISCADEQFLHPAPYSSREAWCAARLELSERRLEAIPAGHRLILINHFPLRFDLIRIFRVPRFTPWCGSRRTEEWHVRYPVDVVVSGHLHMRATDWRDGVRFEEVSLGYPRHWKYKKGISSYLREILPGPPIPEEADPATLWHR